ncbi:MAG: UDP-3-O-(3-hydroxymyristoyl)glucosamine N-acyltransferase [Phycisphaera sp.]|nr:UDP-3-O-(3-hydroxymyristoyl)glucosamine N-acyltransferase [Phycisphaera sp.]
MNIAGLLDGPSTATAIDLATLVGGDLEGSGDVRISGVEALVEATSGDLTFIGDARHARLWADASASVALVTRELELGDWDQAARAIVRVDDADQAMIIVLEALEEATRQLADRPEPGIHPSAVVDETANVGDDVAFGPGVVVGRGVTIGNDVVLDAGVRIYADATIGEDSHLHAHVVIRERCRIGSGCILHAGVVIGSDGFGYRPDPSGAGLRKIPHLGHVEIGTKVEIGANTCIDRGKFGATVIGDGSKIDNLCQIGHNCRIGRHVVISGLTGVAGSTSIGDGTLVGGGCGLADHLKIGAGCQIGARSGIMNDVPDGETWAGFPAKEIRQALKEQAVIRRLPEWSRKLRDLCDPS